MSEATSFYNDNVSDKRYLILSDMEQVMPATRCKVTEARKDKSNTGKEFPVLVLQDEDGNEYQVCAWQRDVRRCIKEWGGVSPTDWGYVSFIAANGGKRYELAPSQHQEPDAEDV